MCRSYIVNGEQGKGAAFIGISTYVTVLMGTGETSFVLLQNGAAGTALIVSGATAIVLMGVVLLFVS